MIWESLYWKEELLRKAIALERYSEQHHWPDRALARAERILMTSFFEIRKLCDSRILTDKITRLQVPLKQSPPLGKTIHLLNRHRVTELYDISRASCIKKDLKFVCNQFVHTYVFELLMSRSGCLAGAFFSSDSQRLEMLFRIDILTVIRILKLVGHDYPKKSVATFNHDQNDYTVSNE